MQLHTSKKLQDLMIQELDGYKSKEEINFKLDANLQDKIFGIDYYSSSHFIWTTSPHFKTDMLLYNKDLSLFISNNTEKLTNLIIANQMDIKENYTILCYYRMDDVDRLNFFPGHPDILFNKINSFFNMKAFQ